MGDKEGVLLGRVLFAHITLAECGSASYLNSIADSVGIANKAFIKLFFLCHIQTK